MWEWTNSRLPIVMDCCRWFTRSYRVPSADERVFFHTVFFFGEQLYNGFSACCAFLIISFGGGPHLELFAGEQRSFVCSQLVHRTVMEYQFEPLSLLTSEQQSRVRKLDTWRIVTRFINPKQSIRSEEWISQARCHDDTNCWMKSEAQAVPSSNRN